MDINTKNLGHTIRNIRRKHPRNLMAASFDPEWFEQLSPPMQNRFMAIINTGIKNPDSTMGAYAMDTADYADFAPFFDRLIRAFHKIPQNRPIRQIHDWNTTTKNCDLAQIDPALNNISMRVRVARNVSGFPLPGAMNRTDRLRFEEMARKAFAALRADPAFGGHYLSLTPGAPDEISKEEYQCRVAAHQMFKDMSRDRFLNAAGISHDWPHGRGMYVSAREDFLVWVGEEDQLRIMAMHTGSNLNALFDRLHAGVERLAGLFPPFAMSPKYGAIASCPTNLGAGMRASVHVRLPRLCAKDPGLKEIGTLAEQLGLAVRGAGGEHSGAGPGGLVDISPSARLGVTEMQIMQRLHEGIAELWKRENSI